MKVGLLYPVLLVSAREEAAQRLGISVADVVNVAYGNHAYRDGKLFDADAFREAFPDDEFDAFTAAEALPADLLVKELDVQRDPAQRLELPITAADVAAVDVVALAARVARLTELAAPGIILRHARHELQRASETGERHTQLGTDRGARDWRRALSAGRRCAACRLCAAILGRELRDGTAGLRVRRFGLLDAIPLRVARHRTRRRSP